MCFGNVFFVCFYVLYLQYNIENNSVRLSYLTPKLSQLCLSILATAGR